MPFYEELRALLHYYYVRCLGQNFFAGGQDCPFQALATDYIQHRGNYSEEIKLENGGSYCPMLLLTITSSDYQPPGDDDTINEICLSPLHAGCEETGFYNMQRSWSLAKGAALTGAGCLDAISLSMMQWLSLRFWLEALNLTWGDFVLFEKQSRITDFVEKAVDKCGIRRRWEPQLIRAAHRFVGGFLWWVTFLALLTGWRDGSQGGCQESKFTIALACWAILVLLISGFFSHVPWLGGLAINSINRLFLQVSTYLHVGNFPPKALYCTDGGVMDCTAIGQLLRRREKKILLVLAAADPRDELNVLKTAMTNATKNRVASFFDPEVECRSIEVILERWNKQWKSGEVTNKCLKIGVAYSFDESVNGNVSKGYIYVVKNRLPECFKDAKVDVEPPLSIEEIQSGFGNYPEDVQAEFKKVQEKKPLKATDLGPFGCCDCCHTRNCNCGPKFPHGSFTGYLYLSPMWFSSLVRLGYRLSKDNLSDMFSEVSY